MVVEGKEAKHLFKDIGSHACYLQAEILDSFPRVYARVSPQDKFDLVLSCMLSRCGATTGMVGDGVNDVLALGIANVGITLASSGTELAKRKARVILLKDAFIGIGTQFFDGIIFSVSNNNKIGDIEQMPS